MLARRGARSVIEQGRSNSVDGELDDRGSSLRLTTRDSEERWKSVLESLQDVYFEATLDDVLTFQSPAALKMYGPAAGDMIGMRTRDLYVDAARYEEVVSILTAGRPVHDFEAQFRVGDRTLDVSINCRLTLDGRRPTGTNGTVRDITARKSAERALQKSEQRYRLLIETSTEGIVIISSKDEILFANASISRIFGYEIEDLLGKRSSEFLSARFHDGDPAQQELSSQLGGVAVRIETAYQHRDGHDVWVLLSSSPLPLDDGTMGLLVTVTDISDRKQMEEAMLESERRYRETFETLDDVYFKTDGRGAIVMMSPSVFRHTGYTPDELVGMPASVVFADPEDHARLVLELMQRRAVSDFPAMLCRRDGEQVPASVTASVVENTSGAIIGFHGTLRDVSERKRMEDAMRFAEARLAGIIDSASDAIVSVGGEDHCIQVFNRGAESVFHKTAEEVLGKHISVILPLSVISTHEQSMGNYDGLDVVPARVSGQEISGTWADGRPLVLDARLSKVKVGDQSLLTVIVRDITEQKRAAQERETLVATLESNARAMEAHSMELGTLHAEAERLANEDQLTGLRNRRAWYLEAEKVGQSAVAMFDIDFFKQVNDTHGHPVGDSVLQEVATRLETVFDGRGILGRLGGEEFGVVFSMPFEDAEQACEEAVAAIAAKPIRLPNGHFLKVTISAGLAAWRERSGPKASLEATCIEADGALYHAKHSGRERLSIGRRRAA